MTALPKIAPPPRQSRMTLANVSRGRIAAPIRALLFGPEKIGKSTFGSEAPKPIFICAEEGTENLDVARMRREDGGMPETWQDVLDGVHALEVEQHDFKTVVLDTLDWMEPLIWRHLCVEHKATSIEEVGGGYGRGYAAAVDEWRKLLSALERVRAIKGMHVILLAHSWVKNFKDPESEGYDRYQLKINEKAAAKIKEWPDAVLFTNYRTFAVTDKKTKRVRGVDDGARVIYTTRRAAFDAGNRYSLPHEMNLSWSEFHGAVQAFQGASPATIREQIEAALVTLADAQLSTKVRELVAQAADDTGKLTEYLNRLNTRLEAAKGE